MAKDQETAFAALQRREPVFHRPEFGTTRADFERMTAPEFWEVGASGNIYQRQDVLDILEQRHAQPHEDAWQVQDFACREISADHYLVTYTLLQGERVSRRASLWRKAGRDWQIVYHQGTLVT